MSNFPDASPRKGSVTALVRGLRILQCFDRPGLELTVSEIARQIGLSQPTAWRLCSTLIDCGFLVRAPAGSALRVGAPALTLGYAAIQGQDLTAIVRPYIAQVAAQLGATITLGLCNGLEIVSVDQVNGNFVLPNQPVGWRAAMTSVASGLAVLAVMAPADRDAAIAALAARDPAAWPRRHARIEVAAAQFAQFGYVSSEGMFDRRYDVAAVPLLEGDGASRRYWALTCGGVRAQWPGEALAQAAERLKDIRDLVEPAVAGRASPEPRLPEPA